MLREIVYLSTATNKEPLSPFNLLMQMPSCLLFDTCAACHNLASFDFRFSSPLGYAN